MEDVRFSRPGLAPVVVSTSTSEVAHVVDAEGAYVGLIPVGTFAPLSGGRVVVGSAPPGSGYVWNGAWVYQPTLDDLRAKKWAEIKRARDAFEFGGFTWDGSTFDSDEASQSKVQGAALMAFMAKAANESLSLDWTLADNTVRTLDRDQLVGVGLALGAHIQAAHEIGRTLRASIEAAPAEGLAAIVWPT